MTFIEKFNELKAQLPTLENGTFEEDFAIQVNMTDPECGGTFYIASIGGVFCMEPYDYRDHNACVTVPASFLTDLLAGKADPVKAFMFGEVRIEGDFEQVKALAPLLKPKRARRTAKPKSEGGEAKPKRTCKKKTEGDAPKKPAAKRSSAKKSSKKTAE